jgi:predicted ATPase
MRILSLTYHDHIRDWHLEKAEFAAFTLLVGVSGAGKTMILKAIQNLMNTAGGAPIEGIEWELAFQSSTESNFTWKGKFDWGKNTQPKPDSNGTVYESLTRDGIEIFNRTSGKLVMEGLSYELGLSPNKSVFALLEYDPRLMDAHRELRLVSFMDRPSTFYLYYSEDEYKAMGQDRIFSPVLPGPSKLPLAFFYRTDIFESVKKHFLSIFPSIADIRFLKEDGDGQLSLFEKLEVQIIEKSSKDWIGEDFISSGMLKVFHLLGFLHLASPGSVILIDEFENSLGVNCIEILQELGASINDVQYIITSHHPYIINNVSPENWFLVIRKGNKVRTRNTSQLELPKSKHAAFQQLINSEEYIDSIAA